MWRFRTSESRRFTAPRKRKPLDPEVRAALIARLSVYNGTAATDAAA